MKKNSENIEKKQVDTQTNLHEIFWYFLIFSIIGLLIETFYCYASTGVIESRKGLLWGPFCPVYGVGATILILLLNKYKEHPVQLFFYGIVLGDIVEYILSFILEAMYGTRFWEYSYISLNLNGRICITYSIFWGILAFVLIRFAKPLLDKFICKIPFKLKNILEVFLFLFLVVDVIATIVGVSLYKKRAMRQYYHIAPKTTSSSFLKNAEDILFTDEIMKKTFPNLRFIDHEGNEIFIKTIL